MKHRLRDRVRERERADANLVSYSCINGLRLWRSAIDCSMNKPDPVHYLSLHFWRLWNGIVYLDAFCIFFAWFQPSKWNSLFAQKILQQQKNNKCTVWSRGRNNKGKINLKNLRTSTDDVGNCIHEQYFTKQFMIPIQNRKASCMCCQPT